VLCSNAKPSNNVHSVMSLQSEDSIKWSMHYERLNKNYFWEDW